MISHVFNLLCVLAVVNVTYSWVPHFLGGRPRGGFVPPPPTSDYNRLMERYEELWFNQSLDHFNVIDTRVFPQRYYMSKRFFKRDGPVFLLIGGEAPISLNWMDSGAWVDNAKRYKAMMFQVEHRYYGMTRPTPDMSTKNMRWLSSDQALGDLAQFIEFAKHKYNLDGNKWIVIGGSYSGSLAAWFRLKYPHLVAGALASSAPVLALLDFKDRSWIYQTCTEFGFYQTTDSDRQLFGNGFPLKWFTQQCQDIYGSQFSAAINSRAVKMTNTDYGGQQPKVTKVVFPNGSIDPWHVLGVTDDLGATAIAVYINGTSHCADMYSCSPDDPPELIQAHKEIENVIGHWIA